MAIPSEISSTHGFDYEHRDPIGINDHVRVSILVKIKKIYKLRYIIHVN